jgi:CheY-like chemotaxis protein
MKKIFIFEDDGSMRELLTRFIQRQGYKVDAFTSPEKGIPEVFATPPDLIISDINMPGMSGLEMTSAIRNRGLNIPIVLITGNLSKEAASRAESLSVRYLLKKPFKDLDLLKSAVEDELAGVECSSITRNFDDLRLKFLFELSHEIRTPLTAIRLALEGLSAAGAAESSQAKLLSISRRNLDRIISIVEGKLGVLHNRLVD